MSKSGIYQILNSFNNKSYIGSAVSINDRRTYHFNLLSRNCHPNSHLQGAYNIYALDAFKFQVLELVTNKSSLIEREQYWMNSLKPEYNLTPNAGSSLGFKHTSEAKAKISATHKGRVISIDHRQKISQALSGRKQTPDSQKSILFR